jgi:hypothetical protein
MYSGTSRNPTSKTGYIWSLNQKAVPKFYLTTAKKNIFFYVYFNLNVFKTCDNIQNQTSLDIHRAVPTLSHIKVWC